MKKNILKTIWLMSLIFILAFKVYAVEPNEILSDPKLEARARVIERGLRCLVCQNQSIDDSNADLAHDLRLIVRERLVAGDSDKGVQTYIVSRYGDYVLLDPPFKAKTWILWLGPPILLLTALGLWFMTCQNHKKEKGKN